MPLEELSDDVFLGKDAVEAESWLHERVHYENLNKVNTLASPE